MSSVSPYSVMLGTANAQKRLIGALPKKLQKLASFGLKALVFTPFSSCNSNARVVDCNRSAAEMRMYRLLRHVRLADLVMKQLRFMMPLSGKSVVNIDFSNFRSVAVLVGAVQTKHGRAIPWALQAMISNTQGHHTHRIEHARHKLAYRAWRLETGGDQYDMVLRFIAFIDQQASNPPRLVFDRGFSNARLLHYLFNRDGKSYIRIRDRLRVTLPATKRSCRVDELSLGDYTVRWHGLVFRVAVVSTQQSQGSSHPWIIATNDTEASLKQVTKLYYHRFEIEETFRDWKSCLGLKQARFMRWQSLHVVLSFASIGILLAWMTWVNRNKQTVNDKHSISFFRYWQEVIQWQIRQQGLNKLIRRGT